MIETSDTNVAAFVRFVAPPIDNDVFSNVFLSIRDTARVKITSIPPDICAFSRSNVPSLMIYIHQLIH